MCEPLSERLLSSKAVIQDARKSPFRTAAFGQKQPFGRPQKTPLERGF